MIRFRHNAKTQTNLPGQDDTKGVTWRVTTILLFGLAIGTCGSFLAVGFVEAISFLEQKREESGRWMLLIIPVIGGFIVAGMVYLMSGRQSLSLTGLVLHTQTNPSRLSFRDGLLNAAAAIIAMGSGASVGPYGPLATMGATVGCHISRFSRADITLGIGCGVAAAISTAFSAPIAAIVFVHEVILRHYSLRAFAPITVASSTGFFVSNYLLGRPPLFRVIAGRSEFAPEIIAFVLVGIIAALVAVATMRTIMVASALAENSRISRWLRPAVAGLGMGLMAQWLPEVMGVGKSILTHAITDDYYSVGALSSLLVMKILATALCIGFGFVGGVFSPALVIGILSGALFGQCAEIVFGEASSGIAFYAICGMMAVTSPIIGAPLTAILIVFELTRNYELTTVVMVSVVFSNVVAYRLFGRSLFDQQLSDQGFDLSLGRDKVILQQNMISELVTTETVSVRSEQCLSDAMQAMISVDAQECYVVDDMSKYLGRLRLFDILRLQKRVNIDNESCANHVDNKCLTFQHDISIWQALEKLDDFRGESIPIVDGRGYFLGIIYQSALITAYFNTSEKLRAEEHAAN